VLQRRFGGRQFPRHAAAGVNHDTDTCGRIDVALKTEDRPLDAIFIDDKILLAQILNPASGAVVAVTEILPRVDCGWRSIGTSSEPSPPCDRGNSTAGPGADDDCGATCGSVSV